MKGWRHSKKVSDSCCAIHFHKSFWDSCGKLTKIFFFFFQKYPQPTGQERKMIVKCRTGGCIILVLICTVWPPLLLMPLQVRGRGDQPAPGRLCQTHKEWLQGEGFLWPKRDTQLWVQNSTAKRQHRRKSFNLPANCRLFSPTYKAAGRKMIEERQGRIRNMDAASPT